MTRYRALLVELRNRLAHDSKWVPILMNLDTKAPRRRLHLAVLVEPYLSYILEGKKTIESRFSVNRTPPYGRVSRGDVLLLKKAAGPIVALCVVGDSWTYDLEPTSWKEIHTLFSEALCISDDGFWARKRSASYATLMRIEGITEIDPIKFEKRDRRGWVILQPSDEQLELLEK